MASFAPVECDLINASTAAKLHTVRLSVIPRVGEEMDLDVGGRESSIIYQVVRVLYHVRPRKVVRTDDLFGVSIYIKPA